MAPLASPPVSRTTNTRLLRIEAVVIAAAAIVAYRVMGGGWGMYAALWLTPDLAIAAYLMGPRIGAVAYNTTHSFLLPGLLIGAALWLWPSTLGVQLGLLWISHVAMDRAMGFGLKYATGFKDTHLART